MPTLDELSFHPATRQYYKTCRRKRYYFGTDPKAAVERFSVEWPFIVRGLPVPSELSLNGITVIQLLDEWAVARKRDHDAGRIRPTTYAQYTKVAQFQIQQLGGHRVAAGVGPIDFAGLRDAMPGEFGDSVAVLKRVLVIARMPWKWAYESGLLEKPARFGPDFKAPAEAEKRQQRHDRGRQVFTAGEIRAMIDLASPLMRAAILLGINGGYTQSEVSALREKEVDLETALVDHLRPKTKVKRTVPLMAETVDALRAYLEVRTRPRKEAKGLLFISREGHAMNRSWLNDKGGLTARDSLLDAFTDLKEQAGIKLNRAGFGKLRATFRTVADAAGDDNATRRIMGHDLGQGVESAYIRDIEPDRLRAVVDHVHAWLYAEIAC